MKSFDSQNQLVVGLKFLMDPYLVSFISSSVLVSFFFFFFAIAMGEKKRKQEKEEKKMEVGRKGGGRWRRWHYSGIMGLHVAAILIFTRGFLLTRTELPYYSHCSDVSGSPCFPSSSAGQDGQCWTKPAVDRLVIIVLDALRFDFVAPSTLFPEKKPWMDKLTVLQKVALAPGSAARIFKAIADPPTTSLQRLKGLTTGGLPTFIDVGNSFGAPAIVEDNLIHQLVQNGKRVVMMGDDTWTQLFPHHFNKSYPYPSFNVKDLHTVDNGCIEHLFPTLYEDDWDVLIAHFLGVDHAGHILGVNSMQMMEKLDQYNLILEKVINLLESQSGPGGLHENTLLLVMGDHGQTMNGDHGGGSAEEVETSIFAMSFKNPHSTIPPEFGTSSCELELEEKKRCISFIQQLDFVATVSALIGIPFPFGSIGRVNPELYALGANTWNLEDTYMESSKSQSNLEEWVQNYANVLCINAWQVKRYIDVYSASSVIGFSAEDLSHISDVYDQAEKLWSHTTKNLFFNKNETCHTLLPSLKRQIDAYFDFLSNVSELARSKWTQFNLTMMSIGLGIMLISLFVSIIAIQRVNEAHVSPLSGNSGISFQLLFSFAVVAIRACSFLSNSYILEEGKVASFLLATTGIVKLRYSIMKRKMLVEAAIFLLLISILRFAIEVGLLKQAATSQFMSASNSWILGITLGHPIWMYIAEIGPVLSLILLTFLLYRIISSSACSGIWKYIILGTISSYQLIVVHWVSESNIPSPGLSLLLQGIGKSYVPRIVYAISLGQLLLVVVSQLLDLGKTLDCKKSLNMKTVALLSAWSSTIILLSGKQGSLVALASIIGGYCIMRLESLEEDTIDRGISTFCPVAITQWNLLAACLFFATGHWCAFDGLRYGAAFIGFDEFVLVRQAILLAIETFGFSHILPVFGLPFLALSHFYLSQNHSRKHSLFQQLYQMYVMYGLIMATTVTATTICVTLHRRHLMVWGLFAPKFVFDVVGLILTDVLICLASLFYSGELDYNTQKDHQLTE